MIINYYGIKLLSLVDVSLATRRINIRVSGNILMKL